MGIKRICFYISIPELTKAIKVYLNTYQTLEEREQTRNTTVTELKELGWSGTACDAFMEAHEQKMQLHAKLKEDILYMINALQEEKQRALMLKMRCEDFVNCIDRTGQGGSITGDDELDFSSQGKINNYVNNCVDDDYVKLNSNFSKIQDILNSLEYTSFGIEGDVDTLKNSVKDQTESLTEFDDSFNVYYAGVKDMESNICSVFSKISANGYSPFQNSSVLAPNGEIDKNSLVNAVLKNQSGFTINTLGANTNITNGMNLENLSYEVDNDIDDSEDTTIDSVDDNDLLNITTTTDGAAVTVDSPDLDDVTLDNGDTKDDSIDDDISDSQNARDSDIPSLKYCDTGDSNVDIAFSKWYYYTSPGTRYADDPRYTAETVAAFQNKLMYMSEQGIDVTQLDIDELTKLFEDEANFPRWLLRWQWLEKLLEVLEN